MTDIEFDIIDELYFVTSYSDLKEATQLSDDILKGNLISLTQKGWIRVYKEINEESEIDKLDLEKDIKLYFYLASKQGLLKHNSK